MKRTYFVLFFAAITLLLIRAPLAQLFHSVAGGSFSGPFGGTPVPFFNQTAAVNYNYGGQGPGYNVPSPFCKGITCVTGASGYRADAVNFKASTFGSGFNWQLGFGVSPNAWNYTINISQPGPYIVKVWTGSDTSGGSWNVMIDNKSIGTVATPSSGYATPTLATSPQFDATLGTHTLTLAWASGDGFGVSGDLVAWQGAQAGLNVSSCDVGPSYNGPVPPAAAQAGFTHCAANYDFTQTQQWNDQAGTHQWSNLGSWLSCTNSTSNASYLLYHEGNQPCNQSYQNVVFDGGVQTLALSLYALNDYNNNDTAANTQSGSGTPAIPWTFPPQHYIEQVMRPSINQPSAGHLAVYYDISSLAIQDPTNTVYCMLGGDYAEQNGNTSNSGISGWNLLDASGNKVCNQNTGQYHFGPGGSPTPIAQSSGYQTYGALITQDNGTNGQDSMCVYYSAGAVTSLDKTKFVQCFTENPPVANWTDVTSRQMFLYIGNPAYLWNQGQTVTAETTYIQRITIWTCPGYQTNKPAWTAGPCYTTPVITTAPP